MKKYILIVAGGDGNRFGGDVPKQFMLFNGKPLLLHTINAFLRVDQSFKLVLVLPGNMVEHWKSICKDYHFKHNHLIVSGGEDRQWSVMAGLKYIPDDSLVAIHDGVRPVVSARLIEEGFKLAKEKGSAIPVVEVADSVREVVENSSSVVNRENLRLVQTPQFFHSEKIKVAYFKAGDKIYSDDASVYENVCNEVYLFSGERENIKITYPVDLISVEALLK